MANESSCSGCSSSGDSCNSCPSKEQQNNNVNNIAHKYIVMSGKGGVGKSSVAVNLATWLAMQGKKVGLLDVDLHGPSIPKLLNIGKEKIEQFGDMILPVGYSTNLKVMSIGFMLEHDHSPVIWRGPMKHGMIEQFVNKVFWGALDYLIVDCPPGTGDEPLSATQVIGNADGAIVVTTPQDLAVLDVKKCLTFCEQIKIPVLGIIENMSGFSCPHCHEKINIFKYDGGRILAEEKNIPFLGAVPISPDVASNADQGKPIVESNPENPAAQAFAHAFKPLLIKE